MFLDLLQYATVFLRHQAETLIGRSSHFRSKRKELDSGDIKVIKEAAQKLGIEVENLGFNAYELKKGNIIRRIKTDMTNDLDNAFTYWLTGNKYVTFEILKKYGIKNIPCCSVYSLANIQGLSGFPKALSG